MTKVQKEQSWSYFQDTEYAIKCQALAAELDTTTTNNCKFFMKKDIPTLTPVDNVWLTSPTESDNGMQNTTNFWYVWT